MINKINELFDADQPQNKLFSNGEHTLTDVELLAIILRTGNKNKNSIELAKEILQKFGSIAGLTNTDNNTWKSIKGVGKSKISRIKASIEIGRRLPSSTRKKIYIRQIKDILEIYGVRMKTLKIEIFKLILLSAKNEIIRSIDISTGTPSSVTPSIRKIIANSLQFFAVKIICMHNHPSGDSNPGIEDKKFTRELEKTCKTLDLILEDHLIFGSENVYSFKRGIFEY